MKAIVLIRMNAGDQREVLFDLRRLRHVAEAHLTFGPYDLLAIVQATALSDLGRIVANEIQLLPGVVSTCTCAMVDGELVEEIQVSMQPGEKELLDAGDWPYKRGFKRPFGLN